MCNIPKVLLAGLLVLTTSTVCRADDSSWQNSLAYAFSEAAWEQAKLKAKGWVRETLVTPEDLTQYGLQLETGWQSKSKLKPVVVLIHGFNSTPEKSIDLLEPVRDTDFPCGTFAYPNDHVLHQSTLLLSHELKAFARQYPDRQMILVCHSMGSLVARDCIEDAELDPGNVERLIMVAPPTHGTYLAHMAFGTDVWEHWIARSEGWPWTRMHDSVVDGLGEAAVDLRPGSAYLSRLNSRPLNPNVRYSIILGTTGFLTEEDVQCVRSSIDNTLGRLPVGQESVAELDALIADMEEFVHGKGDGVVAVSRGRLRGVDDTVLLPFGHLKFTAAQDQPEFHLVHAAILERLE